MDWGLAAAIGVPALGGLFWLGHRLGSTGRGGDDVTRDLAALAVRVESLHGELRVARESRARLETTIAAHREHHDGQHRRHGDRLSRAEHDVRGLAQRADALGGRIALLDGKFQTGEHPLT